MKIHFLKAFQKTIASKSLLQNPSQGGICVELAASNCFLTSDMEALGFDMWFTALLILHNNTGSFLFSEGLLLPLLHQSFSYFQFSYSGSLGFYC